MDEKIRKAREAFELLNASIDVYHTYRDAESGALYTYETTLRHERERYLRVLEGDRSINELVTTTDMLRAERDYTEAVAMSKAMLAEMQKAHGAFKEALIEAGGDIE